MKKSKVEKYLEKDSEYYKIVKTILEHPEFIKRKEYVHHESSSVYDHCLAVSIVSYLWAKKMRCDYKSAAIGGLLHDFYDKPWQTANHKLVDNKKTKILEKHGFAHAGQAAENAYKYFPELMTPKIEDIIRRHMFPLNIRPPKYKESWIITLADKYISMDVLKSPKEWPKYIGLGKKEKK